MSFTPQRAFERGKNRSEGPSRPVVFPRGCRRQASDGVGMQVPHHLGHRFQVSGHCVSKRVFKNRLRMWFGCTPKPLFDTVSKSAVIAFPRGCSRTDFRCGSDVAPKPFWTLFPSQRSLRFQEGLQEQTSDVVRMYSQALFDTVSKSAAIAFPRGCSGQTPDVVWR
jgi:hypothetical protein